MIKVYGAYKNADMTEGKGPMVLDRVFALERDAHAYINQQEGVFGRRPDHGWQNSNMGDWQVKPIDVLESLEDSAEEARRQNLERAMQKLTREEREAFEEHVRGRDRG